MSDSKLSSLRAIAHQLDAWLALHGDTAKPLRALLLLRDEISSYGPVPTATETKPAAAAPPADAAPKAAASEPSALDMLTSLLGILPQSVVSTVITEVTDKAKSLETVLGMVSRHVGDPKNKP